MVHRIGALVVTVAIIALTFSFKNYTILKNNLFLMLILLAAQVALGIINVVMSLPMFAAGMHNAVELGIMPSLISLAHKVFNNPMTAQ